MNRRLGLDTDSWILFLFISQETPSISNPWKERGCNQSRARACYASLVGTLKASLGPLHRLSKLRRRMLGLDHGATHRPRHDCLQVPRPHHTLGVEYH